MSSAQNSDLLADRYGAPSAAFRGLAYGIVGVLVALLAGWWAWAAWSEATPQVRSELVGFAIDDEHRSTASINVVYGDDFVTGTCTVRALAEDHTTVGETIVDLPLPGGNPHQIDVRTERRATAVTLVGCATPDQPRPR